jgi:D-xylose transport system ATP-binding protein
MSSSGPLLSVRALRKRFGAVEALSGVDLDLPAGEVVALVGDNGAGKSTLVKAVAGTHLPDGGTITLDGRPVHIGRPSEAQALGITTVFQDLALCENLDVIANLYLGRELRRGTLLSGIRMERATRELLASLDVRIGNIRAPVSALSGGQRQSVAIARALVAEPRVVLLDEPTAALGVEQTAKVLDLIRRLRDRGLAVMVISHNLADVFRVSDFIWVLRLGRNAGTFRTASSTQAEVVAAITGSALPGGQA